MEQAADTLSASAAAGADAVGLVFVEASPRCVDVATARAISQALPALVTPVALFADAPLDVIRGTAAAAGVHTVQLHGHESPGDIVELSPLRVLKALPFNPLTADHAVAPFIEPPANLAGLLWDAPPKPSDLTTGGTGRSLDWKALAQRLATDWAELPPTLLAGGLHPENVGEAIRRVRPYGVDVSTGVESAKGVKDVERIAAFCAAVRAADADRSGPA